MNNFFKLIVGVCASFVIVVSAQAETERGVIITGTGGDTKPIAPFTCGDVGKSCKEGIASLDASGHAELQLSFSTAALCTANAASIYADAKGYAAANLAIDVGTQCENGTIMKYGPVTYSPSTYKGKCLPGDESFGQTVEVTASQPLCCCPKKTSLCLATDTPVAEFK